MNVSMRRWIDHRKIINNSLLCIETDEYQHKAYDKEDEEHRYDDIFMALGYNVHVAGLAALAAWIAWLR